MQSFVETATSSNGDRDASQLRPGVSRLAISSVNVAGYRSLGAGTTVGIDYADAVVEQRRYGTTSGSSPDLDRVGRQCSHHSNLFGHVDAAGHALQGVWGTNSPKCDLNLDGTINATDQSTQLGNTGVSRGFAELTRNRNRLGFAGYAADSESAERWHVRHRVLKSKLGRWTKRDPIGYIDGGSVYAYVQSSPLFALDPSGLACTVWADCSLLTATSADCGTVCMYLCLETRRSLTAGGDVLCTDLPRAPILWMRQDSLFSYTCWAVDMCGFNGTPPACPASVRDKKVYYHYDEWSHCSKSECRAACKTTREGAEFLCGLLPGGGVIPDAAEASCMAAAATAYDICTNACNAVCKRP
jgi:RHS repeat-associated protein